MRRAGRDAASSSTEPGKSTRDHSRRKTNCIGNYIRGQGKIGNNSSKKMIYDDIAKFSTNALYENSRANTGTNRNASNGNCKQKKSVFTSQYYFEGLSPLIIFNSHITSRNLRWPSIFGVSKNCFFFGFAYYES